MTDRETVLVGLVVFFAALPLVPHITGALMDPLKPLRNLPEKARAYYYRIATAVGGVALAVDALDGTVTYGALVGAGLGLVAALLATANTSR